MWRGGPSERFFDLYFSKKKKNKGRGLVELTITDNPKSYLIEWLKGGPLEKPFSVCKDMCKNGKEAGFSFQDWGMKVGLQSESENVEGEQEKRSRGGELSKVGWYDRRDLCSS